MIDHLDHLVLTTSREAACLDFYTRVLGMEPETFVGGTPRRARKALKFGAQKINVPVQGAEFEPKAHLPVPGALDVCCIVSVPLVTVIDRVKDAKWPIQEGPVLRTGATGKIRSIYVRDPDLNLIELSVLE
jgi:catechol 2,3-dioxygenase-like lactoylglutathione lyase family enzyme